VTKTGGGTVIFDTANTYTGTTSINQGTLLVTNSNALASSPILVQTSGTLALPTASRLVLSATSVTVDQATGGTIDIGKGRINIAPGGTTEEALRADLIAGRSGGTWTSGTGGIVTTGGTAGLSTSPVVGYRVFATGSAVVAWAAFGDANLDGQVNFSDVQLINNGGKYGQGSSTGATWSQGDFNYSGGVTFTDINLMNNSGLFGTGSYLPVAGLAFGEGGLPVLASVPEPGAWALAFAAAGGTFEARDGKRDGECRLSPTLLHSAGSYGLEPEARRSSHEVVVPTANSLHPRRAAGRDRHHRGAHRPPVAGRAVRPRGGAAERLQQQPKAARTGDARPPRREEDPAARQQEVHDDHQRHGPVPHRGVSVAVHRGAEPGGPLRLQEKLARADRRGRAGHSRISVPE